MPSNPALWGGRFSKAIDDIAHRFSSSIAVDSKLWREDIRGSIAHARMLGSTGIILPVEADAIIKGLEAIAGEIERGEFTASLGKDDRIAPGLKIGIEVINP